MKISKLNKPILIAAWPGMGQVAVTACYYLIAKLEMEFHAEYIASELFDVGHVSVENGLIQPFRYPKNQIFIWKNPHGGSDLMVFLGEAQPPLGQYNFCRKLIDIAQREGVTKVYTFAALATGMEVGDESRTIAVATDSVTLHHFLTSEISPLSDGRIAGMNGVLLGVANERNISGGCLLGEMPGILANGIYPRAAVAVLRSLARLTQIEIDLSDLILEASRVEHDVSHLLKRIQKLEQESLGTAGPLSDEDETYLPSPAENDNLSDDERQLIERLFGESAVSRSKAFELKRELDRLEVFGEYEDRFLDLFRKQE